MQGVAKNLIRIKQSLIVLEGREAEEKLRKGIARRGIARRGTTITTKPIIYRSFSVYFYLGVSPSSAPATQPHKFFSPQINQSPDMV